MNPRPYVATGAGGLQLRGLRWGPDEGRPTLILHGFLEQSAAWHAVAPQLDGPVLAYDHRGHGLSDHIGRGGFYHFWDYVSDLDAVVSSLGAPVDIVAHSMGGTVACLFASLRPRLVRRLVLVEGVGPPDAMDKAVERGRVFLNHRASPPPHKPLASVAHAAVRMQRFNKHLSDEVALMLATRSTRPCPEGVSWTWDSLHRSRSPQPFSTALFCRFLAAIDLPTLVVLGGASPYLGIPGLHDRIRALPQAKTLTLDGMGHHMHHECPDALAAAIRKHLEP